MPNPIKLSDLFDFSDRQIIQDALTDIKALEAAYKSFQATVVNGSLATATQQYTNLQQSIQALITTTQQLNIANQQAQANLVSAGAQMASYQNTINQLAAQQQSLTNINNAAKDSVYGLKTRLKELEDEYNKLSQSSSNYDAEARRLVGDITRTKTEINTLTQALRVNVSTYKAAKDSYAALDIETKKLINDVKNLGGAFGANSKQADQMKKTIRENTERLKEFDRQMSINNRNVGNYSSAFGGLTGSLKSYGLGLVSIAALTAGIKKAFDENLNFSGIKRTLEVVSKSGEETSLNLDFLRKAANDLGIEFDTLTTNFNKFYAASTIAGFSANKTREIFLQFANAFSNLHLSQEATNSAFLALEQIVSKGKVSAEELRRQLGNVLPGAFEIAAKSIGVTTTELDKMLRQGQVISAQFLPKFAAEIGKTYGEASGRIDSLQASVARFKNTVNSAFQGEGLTNFFKGFVDGATDAAKAMINFFVPAFEKSTRVFQDQRSAIDATENSLSPLLSKYDELKKTAGDNTQKQDELKSVINQIAGIVPGATTAIDQYGNALDINRQKVIEFTDANRKLSDIFKATALRDLQDNINKSLSAGKDAQFVLNRGQAQKYTRGSGTTMQPTVYPAGDPRAGTFTPVGQGQMDILVKSREEVLKNAAQIVELGGKLDQQTIQFVGAYGATRLQRLKDISDVTDKINTKDLEAYNALRAGDDKLRQQIIKDMDALKKQRQELISPGSTSEATPPNYIDPKIAEKAAAKAARELKKRIKEADDLNKAAAKEEIATAELVFARSQKTTADEIALEEKKFEIVARYADIRSKLYAKDSDDYKNIQTEKLKAEADMLEKRSKLWDDAVKKQQESDKKLLDSAKATIKASGAYYDSVRAGERANQVNGIRKRVASGEMNQTAGEDSIHLINKQSLEEEIELQRYALDQMKIQDASYYDAKKALADKERELAQENADFEIKKAEEVHNRKKELQKLAFDFVSGLADLVAIADSNETQTEIDNLNKKYDIDVELAGENKEAKKRIDKQYQQESARLKRQQAIAEQQAAVFQIGLTTAEKIVEAYPNPYLMAAAAALGALQIASVSSKKIPEYWKGRENGPAELAEVNERGWELIQRKNKYLIAGGGQRTITKLEAGDKVLTHAQSVKKAQEEYLNSADSEAFLNSILEGTQVTRQYEDRMSNRIVQAVTASHLSKEALTGAFVDALAVLPLEVNNWDDGGYKRSVRRGNTLVTEIHERNKIGGRG